MRSSKKMVAALVAVAAVAVLAVPAMASASPAWRVGGQLIGSTPVSVDLSSYAVTVSAPAASENLQCRISGSGAIWNDASGVGQERIDAFSLTDCTSAISGMCQVTAEAYFLPWSGHLVSGSGVRNEIDGFAFLPTYDYGTCNGWSTPAGSMGDVLSEVGANSLTFNGEPGLFSGQFGSEQMYGSIQITAAGGDVTAS